VKRVCVNGRWCRVGAYSIRRDAYRVQWEATGRSGWVRSGVIKPLL
jgi:hypothetical protein